MGKANICDLSVDFESRVISSTHRSLKESSVERLASWKHGIESME